MRHERAAAANVNAVVKIDELSGLTFVADTCRHAPARADPATAQRELLMTAWPPAGTDQTWINASAAALTRQWLDKFERALAVDPIAASELFVADAHWRDILAFTWRIKQVHGRPAIRGQLRATVESTAPCRWRIAADRPAPRCAFVFGREVVEAFVDFDNRVGRGTAVVRLVQEDTSPGDTTPKWRAWLLLTTLRELHESASHARDGADLDASSSMAVPAVRAARYGYAASTPTQSWAEHRSDCRIFADREPDVLIVGAGHSGQMLGARLGQLGVDTLIVDRLPRIGDVWRNRYHSLALHNPTAAADFPYLPFPPTFPRYISKDRLANWLEFYADTMDLNVWTSTEIRAATYAADEQRWEVRLRTEDGSDRLVHPHHLVMATGAFGAVPNIPNVPGLDLFEGQVLHTADFQTGAEFAGKRVLIVGVGTSAHDTALEIHHHGGKATMLQRNPITIVGLETKERFSTTDYPPGASIDDIDLIGAANFVFPLCRDAVREDVERCYQHDFPLIKRLAEAGMRVDLGEDGTGWQMKAWRTGAGYYINVGASEAVAAGDIAIVQQDDTVGIVTDGLALDGGEVLPFDAVILATGFQNLEVVIAEVFGPELAKRLGLIYHLDDYGSGEWTNSWVPTAQEGLWFMVGAMALTRPYSLYLALQLKARLLGLVPATPDAAALAHSSPA
jgi:cation diffusion facilitator CzcD-associated flavoprotein CzcO